MQSATVSAIPASPEVEPWQDDFSTIYRSGQFDHLWYVARYPDVGLTDLSPLEHYVKYGARLGRQPRPDFPGTPDETADGTAVNPFAAWLRQQGDAAGFEASKPVVSVLCITYNQARFIRETLDSLLAQVTDFLFEVLVGDDGSTDGTAEIIAEYATRHPNLIPVLRTKNLGPNGNFADLTRSARGEYVATCEGDDYWSDTGKLQKQVDFLRARPEFTLCFHPVRIVYEDMPGVETRFPEQCAPQPSLTDLATRNFIQTNSVLYRWRYRGAEPFAFDESIAPGDWYVHLMHAEVGRIGFLPQVMAVYRKHAGGMWTTHASEIARHRKLGTAEIALFRRLRGHFGGRFADSFAASQRLIFARLAEACLDEADMPGLRSLIEDHPDIVHETLGEMGFDIAGLPAGDADALRAWFEEQLTVSVIVTAPDLGANLRRCLDGVLAQRGLFRLRVIIGFERSTQAYSEAVATLRASDPDRIVVRPRPQDLSPLRNLQDCIAASDSRYIAFCDPETRWISDRKLAKQLRLLRGDPKLALCFNWVLVHRANEGSLLPHEGQGRLATGSLRFSDLAAAPVTAHRSGGLYRADALRRLPETFFEDASAGDWLMDLYVADAGRIAFLREILSAWTIRDGSPWSDRPDTIPKARIDLQRRQFAALFGRGRGFEPYAFACTVKDLDAPLPPEFARAHLEAPTSGQGAEIEDGYVVFAGWIVPTYGARATLVVNSRGEVHRFPVDQQRSDVVTALFSDGPAPVDEARCGFRFALPFDQHLEVRLLIDVEDAVLPWLSVTVAQRSESEASG